MPPPVGSPSSDDTPPAGSHPPEPGEAQGNGGRRGIRTVALSAVALLSLTALAIGVLWSNLGPPEGTVPSPGSGIENARTGNQPSPSAAEGS